MFSLRNGIPSGFSRVGLGTTRLASPIGARFLTQTTRLNEEGKLKTTPEDAPGSITRTSSTMKESPSQSIPRHQPDYNASVDHGTSAYSPVPKRVLDGSEPGALPAAVLSGAPNDLQARTVRIYKPSKPATQSGSWHSHHWRMDWDVLQKGYRWENPLIGWQSSADGMQGTHLKFKTKEDAIHFAEKQGYEYYVQEPNVRAFKPKSYASNFLHEPNKLKYIKTK